MSQANQVIKDIKNKKLHPIYFLSGDEPFYIDLISKTIEDEVLTEDEKAFNQNIIYGNDVEIDDVIAMAKQYPMGAERQVLIVKEAQHLTKKIEQLESYAENPQNSTVLVLNYKGKTLDKRKKLYKSIQKLGLVLEFKKLYDNQLPVWIQTVSSELGLTLSTKSQFLLAEFLGNDLSRIYNELQKLKVIVKDGKITPEVIEQNIGISKDYNNFELRNAVETKDAAKSLKIAKYFGENPKDNPLIVTLIILHQAFANIILYHVLQDKSQNNVAKEVGISPFFVKDLVIAAKNYPLKKATRIISLLREADAKSKGIGSNTKDVEILNELLVKILTI